jgi:hypothetical protein
LIEAALLVAFNMVYPKDVPAPVDLPPLNIAESSY